MFSKSFIAYAFLLGFTTSVNAHAAIDPALGVKGGNATRNDVQRPSTAKPCGNVNIAQTLDSSTTVAANADRTFSPSITDFNAGADGSRSIKTVQINADGTGKNFVAATMLVNGDANPTSVGTQSLTVQMPAGTKCTGGTSGNLCLASFVTTAGFGNCVAVSQGAQGPNNNTASPASAKGAHTPRDGAKGQKQQDNAAGDKTDNNNSDASGKKADASNKKANASSKKTDASNKKKDASRKKAGKKTNASGKKTDATGNKVDTVVHQKNAAGDDDQSNSAGSKAKATNATRRSTSFRRNWSSRSEMLV